MPCRIEIKERLTEQITIKSEPYLGARLDIAKKEAKEKLEEEKNTILEEIETGTKNKAVDRQLNLLYKRAAI